MQVDDTGEPGGTVTAGRLLDAAEHAFLRAEFGVVRPLLQRFQAEFGTADTHEAAVRYAVLRAALAARVGNWPEAVRRCPDSDLDLAATGVVHALAVGALRRLSEEGGRHTEFGTAALAIVLWAHLLDEDDPGDFRALLTERRGAPVPDELWEEAHSHLLGRITDLLRALDVRAGRDALAAWETAWETERAVLAVLLENTGPDCLIPLEDAARHLVSRDRGDALLDAYSARHPDPTTWTADSPDHRACADVLAQALAERGQSRVRAGEWSEALADFSTAARLGRTLGSGERAAVQRAGKNVGRSRTGRDYSPVTRIQGLEVAHALLPEDGSLAAELTAELVRQGQKVLGSDPRQSRYRFARALVVSPGDMDARTGLDDHLRADLRRALDGAEPRERIRAVAVLDLLQRDPDCASAREWLRNHYAEQAVVAASDGRTATARSAVRSMIYYDGGEGPYGKESVDNMLVDLLIDAARTAEAESTRAGMERRVDLLSTAAGIAGPDRGHVREERDAAVLDLAEHLESTASPSDVIELFLQDRMRTGVSARFDQTVEAAYLRRAEAREEQGDLGGAQHDRACAERIGAGLPAQRLLFGPVPRSRRHPRHDSGQGALF
ncbi:hypothetical protein SSP24_13480 [Streptomyces spinoverrucosus]|uniref:Uncharacterized protein n=1 Tax=Streptomyces spinoverrucosus TaxID=284043 RepID=A0A4Y3VBF0_9ACTN|nr:hypothetical protein [Streptomyces spinoverrucosus]GEC03693.1 hypothetical protein SSP24_13480 [Streptomyces spinoverrucosus]GHB50812.1 hypothetical protein GCM10010397_21190 [Streptomyces spinoverrucosus]